MKILVNMHLNVKKDIVLNWWRLKGNMEKWQYYNVTLYLYNQFAWHFLIKQHFYFILFSVYPTFSTR